MKTAVILKPLVKALTQTIPCRDCQREIRWCKETSDTKGPRCWDCQVIYRSSRQKKAAEE